MNEDVSYDDEDAVVYLIESLLDDEVETYNVTNTLESLELPQSVIINDNERSNTLGSLEVPQSVIINDNERSNTLGSLEVPQSVIINDNERSNTLESLELPQSVIINDNERSDTSSNDAVSDSGSFLQRRRARSSNRNRPRTHFTGLSAALMFSNMSITELFSFIDDDDGFDPVEMEDVMSLSHNESYNYILNKSHTKFVVNKTECPIVQYISPLDDNNDVCMICLEQLEDGDSVHCLPCQHIFHELCLEDWINRKNVCPVCKQNISVHESSTLSI